MADDIDYNLSVYLSCIPERKQQFLDLLVNADRQSLLTQLTLPKNSEERFRIYELCIRISPDANSILDHIFEDAQNDNDPLLQMSALEFIAQHHMEDIQLFIKMYKTHSEDPLLLPSITDALVPMILSQSQPEDFKEIVDDIINRALDTKSDLLGSIPPLARSPAFGPSISKNNKLLEWLSEIPYNDNLRTLNFYIRTLLIKWVDDPHIFAIPSKELVKALSYPSPGMRVAAFEHIAALAPKMSKELLSISKLGEKLNDVTMDSTEDEFRARNKACAALGLRKPLHINGSTVNQRVEAVPDIMVL